MEKGTSKKKVNDDCIYLCIKDTESGIRLCDQRGNIVRGINGFDISIGLHDISQVRIDANLHHIEGEDVNFSVRGLLKTVK